MNEYQMSDYSIFDKAISTTTAVKDKIETEKTSVSGG